MFGTRLKTLRESIGLTQNDLAIRLNVVRTTITAYENSTNQPDFDMLLNIATVFNVSLDYLLGRTNQKYNATLLDENTNTLLEKIDLFDENTKKVLLKFISVKETKGDLLLKIFEVLDSYTILNE